VSCLCIQRKKSDRRNELPGTRDNARQSSAGAPGVTSLTLRAIRLPAPSVPTKIFRFLSEMLRLSEKIPTPVYALARNDPFGMLLKTPLSGRSASGVFAYRLSMDAVYFHAWISSILHRIESRSSKVSGRLDTSRSSAEGW